MNNSTTTRTAILAVLASASMLALSACKVEKTQEGEMPDVKVQAEGGQLPKYDVETAEVKLGTKETTVEVPTATIEMPDDPDNKVTDEVDSSDH